MTSLIFALSFLCFFIHGGFAQTKKMSCPDSSEIAPVKCKETKRKISLKIDSHLQSEPELEKIMHKIRNASGVVTCDEFLEIYHFEFENLGDSVRALDLGVLGKIKVIHLEIEGKFPRVKLPSGFQAGHLVVKNFRIYKSPEFAPNSLNHTLATFDLNKLEFLAIKSSNLSGFPSLLPKLSGLRFLVIGGDDTRIIESGQFRGNPKLEWLQIDNCGLKEIQSDAFHIPNRTSNSTTIHIWNSPLRDSGIHPNNGLAKLKGEVDIHLLSTKITSLGEKNWKGYFTADKKHFLRLHFNPLICSPAMKWLKIGRNQFEEQLKYSVCGNDEERTVFDSDLV